jgi:hypothetical protein
MLRKRPDPLDDYIQSISLSTESKNKRLEFYENLRMFYRRKWQCPVKVPYVQGVEIDLFSLYEIVASMGGWQRVTAADRWNEVACKLSIDENTQNAVHALRLIYTRYLGFVILILDLIINILSFRKYEQAQFGNDNDNEDCDLLGGRLRTKGLPFALLVSTEAPFTVPKSCKFLDSFFFSIF